jgi:putative glutamine amidotransferase
MFNLFPSTGIRIGIYGQDEPVPAGANVGLWTAGYDGFLTAAGAVPVRIERFTGDDSWSDLLDGVQGVVFTGWPASEPRMGDEEGLCLWCRQRRLPILAIDDGLLALNLAFGGNNFEDLGRDLPTALQHRHPPEPGLRHAISVEPKTLIARLYGEGEIVVNSAHRQALNKVAAGFQVVARALDGVTEAVEWTKDNWFAIGVQWRPASETASGLDIQVFRGLLDAAAARPAPRRQIKPVRNGRRLAVSA